MLVLSGTATRHFGADEHELREGDHVWFRAGEHHIENRGSADFKFLVFGERNPGDVSSTRTVQR